MNAIVNDDPGRRFVAAAFAELSFGMLGIALGWLLGPDARAGIPHISDGRGIAEGVLVGACAGVALAAGMSALSRLPVAGLQKLQEVMEERFSEFLAPMTYVELVVLSMTAGLGEELLFRGWLQSGLTGTLDSSADYLRAVSGLLAASLLFGLAHPISRTYVVLAAAMGLVLGALYLATGNLLSAIMAHAVYDAVILVRWKRGWISRNAMRGTP